MIHTTFNEFHIILMKQSTVYTHNLNSSRCKCETHTNTEYLSLYAVFFFFLSIGKYLSKLSLPEEGWQGSN